MIFDDQRVPHENFCLDPKKFCAKFILKIFCSFYRIFSEIFMVQKCAEIFCRSFFYFSQKKACTDRRDWVFHRVQLKFLPDFTVSHKSFQTSVSQYINSVSYAYWINNKWSIICCLGVHVSNLEYVQPACQD